MARKKKTDEDPRLVYEINWSVLDNAKRLVDEAVELRNSLRYNSIKGDLTREAELALSISRINQIMAVIRSERNRIPLIVDKYQIDPAYGPALAEASRTLQLQRRKLRKMQFDPEHDIPKAPSGVIGGLVVVPLDLWLETTKKARVDSKKVLAQAKDLV